MHLITWTSGNVTTSSKANEEHPEAAAFVFYNMNRRMFLKKSKNGSTV